MSAVVYFHCERGIGIAVGEELDDAYAAIAELTQGEEVINVKQSESGAFLVEPICSPTEGELPELGKAEMTVETMQEFMRPEGWGKVKLKQIASSELGKLDKILYALAQVYGTVSLEDFPEYMAKHTPEAAFDESIETLKSLGFEMEEQP